MENIVHWYPCCSEGKYPNLNLFVPTISDPARCLSTFRGSSRIRSHLPSRHERQSASISTGTFLHLALKNDLSSCLPFSTSLSSTQHQDQMGRLRLRSNFIHLTTLKSRTTSGHRPEHYLDSTTSMDTLVLYIELGLSTMPDRSRMKGFLNRCEHTLLNNSIVQLTAYTRVYEVIGKGCNINVPSIHD